MVVIAKVTSVESKRDPRMIGRGEKNCECRYERDTRQEKPFL